MKSCSNTNEKTATGSSCSIKNIYTDDSGEFICETEGGEKSNIINISVTAGSLILESPTVPVMEGEAVTLTCRNKTTSSSFTAEFYKDGLPISNSSTGYMDLTSARSQEVENHQRAGCLSLCHVSQCSVWNDPFTH
ncbi:Fc receptor-like B isoform X2 [Oreochromis aureus]|uniref:Fc receptor-like B isoform X2 n=1 Tax=Oreochromis aureus TaxID=47969 RepID=UPI001953F782|nr:Fc receptor-like B isoform X2 [Oreochromis aureus]